MGLLDLATSLGDQPAILAAIGRTHPVVAVPEPARGYALAAIAALGERRPVIVATPSGVDAERIERDLGTMLGPDAVALFPAWETLPFERVSPGIETMGRRNRLLWSMEARPPQVIVAPVRALVQRLAPGSGGDPLIIGAGDVVALQVEGDSMIEAGVFSGDHAIIRRQPRVENGEVAAVLIDGEGTLKRWREKGRRVTLEVDRPTEDRTGSTRLKFVFRLEPLWSGPQQGKWKPDTRLLGDRRGEVGEVFLLGVGDEVEIALGDVRGGDAPGWRLFNHGFRRDVLTTLAAPIGGDCNQITLVNCATAIGVDVGRHTLLIASGKLRRPCEQI